MITKIIIASIIFTTPYFWLFFSLIKRYKKYNDVVARYREARNLVEKDLLENGFTTDNIEREKALYDELMKIKR